MSKGKLQKFAEMETFKNVFQYPYGVISEVPFEMKGHWREQYFHNDNPIVLELGCGKGEYTVGLARVYPNINFIGVDIKGARIYTGTKQALEGGLDNVAFLRTSIEIIDRFFAKDEVQEIWLTFSDPQMKNSNETNGVQASDFDERTKEILGIHTYYENQWIERGLNIKYMKFSLPTAGVLEEPEVEIELDDYRSFKRTKRSGKDKAF